MVMEEFCCAITYVHNVIKGVVLLLVHKNGKNKKYGQKMFPLVVSLIRGFNYKPYFENM